MSLGTINSFHSTLTRMQAWYVPEADVGLVPAVGASQLQ